jgi:general secretion pathway protein G
MDIPSWMIGEEMAQMSKKFGQNLRRILTRPFDGSQSSGMTLIEIIIVVALLGTLMTYLIRQLTSTADAAKEDQAKLAMGQIAQSLQIYRVHNHTFPPSDRGLDALLNNPGDSKTWRGPYIEKEKLQDPWGHEFQYESDGRKYKMTSGGIDEQLGTSDDVSYPADDAKPEGG